MTDLRPRTNLLDVATGLDPGLDSGYRIIFSSMEKYGILDIKNRFAQKLVDECA